MSVLNASIAEFIFVFATMSVEEHFETLVFDLGSLLAAAGGNLGLFLGFSCLSLVFSFLDYIALSFRKIEKSIFWADTWKTSKSLNKLQLLF